MGRMMTIRTIATLFAIVFLFLFGISHWVTGQPAVTQVVQLSIVDPCQNPAVAKSSVILNATATAQIIPLVASQVIYVCDMVATLGGTTPSLRLQYGTGTTCGTGPVFLTGTYLPTVGSVIRFGFGGTALSTAASNALCVVLAGTSPSLQGFLTYVQQ